MAHWTVKHTKKDIVAHYEAELATLRDDVEKLVEAAERMFGGTVTLWDMAELQMSITAYREASK